MALSVVRWVFLFSWVVACTLVVLRIFNPQHRTRAVSVTKDDFLVIICRMKNEQFAMRSFVPYYLSQGVDRIYLIDDGSTAPYDDVVTNDERVTVIPASLARLPGASQMADADRLYRKIRHRTTWVMSIDADEFVHTRDDRTIRQHLETTFLTADCVFVPWVMFSFNGRREDGTDLIDEYVHRWDHDKKHPHPRNDEKNRCRYHRVECKAVFRCDSFASLKNPHRPTDPVRRAVRMRESVRNTPHYSALYPNLRERDIQVAIMLCNHYRFTSLANIREKCTTASFNKYNKMSRTTPEECVANCAASDYPEVVDTFLKNKWND